MPGIARAMRESTAAPSRMTIEVVHQLIHERSLRGGATRQPLCLLDGQQPVPRDRDVHPSRALSRAGR